jgi:ABC-type xylose transport system permease subunit
VNNIIVPALIPCLSSDCSIVYISADGMLDGGIPARIDIPPGTIVGLRAAGAAPTSVAALLTYYEDPADGVVGQRMRTAKNFLAGIAASDIAGDLINGAVISSINTLAGHLLMGFTTALGGGNWYRNLSSVPAGRHAITSIRRIISTSVRQYVATQRRRLLPR